MFDDAFDSVSAGGETLFRVVLPADAPGRDDGILVELTREPGPPTITLRVAGGCRPWDLYSPGGPEVTMAGLIADSHRLAPAQVLVGLLSCPEVVDRPDTLLNLLGAVGALCVGEAATRAALCQAGIAAPLVGLLASCDKAQMDDGILDVIHAVSVPLVRLLPDPAVVRDPRLVELFVTSVTSLFAGRGCLAGDGVSEALFKLAVTNPTMVAAHPALAEALSRAVRVFAADDQDRPEESLLCDILDAIALLSDASFSSLVALLADTHNLTPTAWLVRTAAKLIGWPAYQSGLAGSLAELFTLPRVAANPALVRDFLQAIDYLLATGNPEAADDGMTGALTVILNCNPTVVTTNPALAQALVRVIANLAAIPHMCQNTPRSHRLPEALVRLLSYHFTAVAANHDLAQEFIRAITNLTRSPERWDPLVGDGTTDGLIKLLSATLPAIGSLAATPEPSLIPLLTDIHSCTFAIWLVRTAVTLAVVSPPTFVRFEVAQPLIELFTSPKMGVLPDLVPDLAEAGVADALAEILASSPAVATANPTLVQQLREAASAALPERRPPLAQLQAGALVRQLAATMATANPARAERIVWALANLAAIPDCRPALVQAGAPEAIRTALLHDDDGGMDQVLARELLRTLVNLAAAPQCRPALMPAVGALVQLLTANPTMATDSPALSQELIRALANLAATPECRPALMAAGVSDALVKQLTANPTVEDPETPSALHSDVFCTVAVDHPALAHDLVGVILAILPAASDGIAQALTDALVGQLASHPEVTAPNPALALLAATPECQPALAQAMAALVSQITVNPMMATADPRTAQELIRALANLAATSECRPALVQAGAAEALAKLLSANPTLASTDPPLAEHLLRAVAFLAAAPGCRPAFEAVAQMASKFFLGANTLAVSEPILARELIRAVVAIRAANSHEGAPVDDRMGMQALTDALVMQLTSITEIITPNPALAQLAVTPECRPALVRAMTAQVGQLASQSPLRSLRAIANLAATPECLPALREAGAVAALAGVLTTNPSDPALVQELIGVISNLTATPECRTAFVQARGADGLVQMLASNPSLATADPALAQQLLRVITNLAATPECRHAFVQARAADAMAGQFTASPTLAFSQPTLACELVRAVANLAATPHECVFEVTDALVKQLATNPEVTTANPVLALLAATPECRSALTRAMGTLVSQLAANPTMTPDNPALSQELTRALANLAATPECRPALVQAGAADALVNHLAANPQLAQNLQNLLRAIANLADTSECRPALVQAGVAGPLTRLLSANPTMAAVNPSLAQELIRAIANLAAAPEIGRLVAAECAKVDSFLWSWLNSSKSSPVVGQLLKALAALGAPAFRQFPDVAVPVIEPIAPPTQAPAPERRPTQSFNLLEGLPAELLGALCAASEDPLAAYLTLIGLSHHFRAALRGTPTDLSLIVDPESACPHFAEMLAAAGHTTEALAAIVGPCKGLRRLVLPQLPGHSTFTRLAHDDWVGDCAWVEEAFGGHDQLETLELPLTSQLVPLLPRILGHLPGLKDLHVDASGARDSLGAGIDLTPIAAKLTHFTQFAISSPFERYLSALSNLRELKLYGSWPSRSFPRREGVLLSNNKDTLRSLSLDVSRDVESLFAALAAMPHLTRLELRADMTCLDLCARLPSLLPNLQHLSLRLDFGYFDQLPLAPPSIRIKSTRLRTLRITNSTGCISVRGQTALTLDCPALEELVLLSGLFSSIEPRCPKLRSLEGPYLGPAQYNLQSIPNLVRVVLHGPQYTDSDWPSLASRLCEYRSDALCPGGVPAALWASRTLTRLQVRLVVAAFPLRLPVQLARLKVDIGGSSDTVRSDELAVMGSGLRSLTMRHGPRGCRLVLNCPVLEVLSLEMPHLRAFRMEARTVPPLRSLAIATGSSDGALGLDPTPLLDFLARHGSRLRHLSLAPLSAEFPAWPQLAAALSRLPRLIVLRLPGRHDGPLALTCPHLRICHSSGPIVLSCPALEAIQR
ncbi:hypothetical protein PAPYR_9489 [Paratrimastix pyriformis]|uniref:Uncharacterized protein n=1 Tax=Paratrimastix pyriformis TaxID=342808 RepID=A0ABQ8U897_9EUKA|nr:hypothetical protein PAPYR_9489 [Paratrimastix pyriformis]